MLLHMGIKVAREEEDGAGLWLSSNQVRPFLLLYTHAQHTYTPMLIKTHPCTHTHRHTHAPIILTYCIKQRLAGMTMVPTGAKSSSSQIGKTIVCTGSLVSASV